MLSHPSRKPGQLLNLMAANKSATDTLALSEQMPARAPPRPVLNHLIDRRSRQQLATMPLMPGLRALTTA